MSFLKKLFSSAYDELWKAVIRPNRDKYSDIELGPDKFELKGKCYKRTDFTLTNKKNNKLVCSFWEPFDEEREYPKLPCVIYLHGNSSSRCEVVPEIKYLLKKGITIFAFDFSGCGRSEGEYISLGWHEQDDVACVVDFLRRSNKVSSIGLWGRSMGAATALMYSTKDLSIAGLVLDSPFSSLKSLINELAKDRVALPDFVVRQAIKWIKETIKEKADFNLDDVEPKDYAGKCFIPAYFCHSKGDTFVNIHHCKDLYSLYAGDKNIVYVKGNHNSERSIHFKDSVAQFFYKALRCKEMEQRYDFNKIYNLEFHYDDNNFCKSIINLKKKNNLGIKKINNSVSEIKITGKAERKIENNENNNDKDDTNIIIDDSEVIYPNDDNIFIHNINVCPKLKTNSEYNQKIINNNINLINKKSRKTPFYVNNSKFSSSNNRTFSKTETESKIQNKEDESMNKKLNLSTKEFEDISIKNPNYINNNNRLSIKKYNKEYISFFKLQKNIKYNEVNKQQNENVSFEQKYKFLSNEMNKTVKKNQSNYSKKINYVKDLKNRRSILLKKLKNKNNINANPLKDKKSIKFSQNSNSTKDYPALIKYPKTSSPELNFENLMKQIKKNGINLKDIKKSTNNNKPRINQIFKIKNINQNNIKTKINKKKEEYKSTSVKNDKRTIFKNLNNNLIKPDKKIEETSKDNNSENTYKNPENKLSSSLFFQENEDDFFLEEDNIKINIPHI